MRTITLLTILALCGGAVMAQDEEPEFTTEFDLDDCRFKSSGTNPYFNLRPGRSVLEAEEDGELERVEITVKNEFHGIFVPGLGVVRTRVIEERESVDGELVEVSRNFFAICSETNDVFYFGEEVDIYHPDGSITHDGAWLAGDPDADGLAEPGLIMPGRFLLGSRYYQEIADGIALDRAEHVEEGLSYETEAGEFDDCVRIVETSPLEPGSESEKVYCRGVGLVADNDAELVESAYIDDGNEDD